MGAYAHQDLPFEKVVEALQPERDLSRTPLFQVMLVLQNRRWRELRLGGLEVQPWAVETGRAKFDLTLVVEEAGKVARGGGIQPGRVFWASGGAAAGAPGAGAGGDGAGCRSSGCGSCRWCGEKNGGGCWKAAGCRRSMRWQRAWQKHSRG